MKKIFVLIFIFFLSIFCAVNFYKDSNSKTNIAVENTPIVEKKIDIVLTNIKKLPENYIKDTVWKIANTSNIELNAKQAIIIDAKSGKVLLEKNADERMLPSSMSKMMTSYIIEDKILQKELSLDSSFLVSQKAWSKQGSKMFVPLGEKVSVADLLKGVIIQSGNDASIVLSEGVSGSEEMFALEMNAWAQKMGLENTQFKNSSGWPEDGHYSTARDMAILGRRVVYDHPDFYKIYSQKNFTFGKDAQGNDITQGNRNPLLYDNLNCDGIKTGHTDVGGYGLVASFLDGDQRYLIVINGLPSMNARSSEAKKLLAWAKENFLVKNIYKKDQVIEQNAKVALGVKNTVSLLVEEDVSLLVPRLEQNKITSQVLVNELVAPLKAGDLAGLVKLSTSLSDIEIPLKVRESVEQVGYLKRLARKVFVMLLGDK